MITVACLVYIFSAVQINHHIFRLQGASHVLYGEKIAFVDFITPTGCDDSPEIWLSIELSKSGTDQSVYRKRWSSVREKYKIRNAN